jgi:adenylate kinase
MTLRAHDDVILLLGAPGAGKGTQARFLAEALGIPHVASGDLLRLQRAQATDLGRAAGQYMDRGELVPDRLVIDMIVDRVRQPDAAHGVLLDGFPRTVAQAHALAELLHAAGNELDAVVALEVPEEVLVKRLLSRGRADDTEDVIRRRLEVYHAETAPLIEHYRDQLVTVDAVGEIEEITERVLDVLTTRSGAR